MKGVGSEKPLAEYPYEIRDGALVYERLMKTNVEVAQEWFRDNWTIPEQKAIRGCVAALGNGMRATPKEHKWAQLKALETVWLGEFAEAEEDVMKRRAMSSLLNLADKVCEAHEAMLAEREGDKPSRVKFEVAGGNQREEK